MAVVRIDLEVNDKGSAQVIGNVGGQLKMMGSEGVKAGAAIGVGFGLATKALDVTIGMLQSVGSAVSTAIQGFVALGGHLADVAAKTAISTQALQKLAYAGSLVGVSEDEITGAAVKMERALANGDAVFGKLGLSVAKLRAMKPDEAFAAIATQIMKIKDPAGQAAAAMEAFGKSGATLLPLMKSDIAAATAEAERLGIVLSDKDVAAADALGDAGTKLGAAWEGVKNQFAAAILQNPAVLQGLESLVRAMGDLSQWLIKNRGAIAALVDVLIGTGQSAVEGFKQLTSWAGAAASKLKYMVDLVPGLRDALKAVKDLNAWLGMKNTEGSGLSSSSQLVQPPANLSFLGKGNPAIKAAADAQKAWQDAAEKAREADDKFTEGVRDNAYKQMLGIQNLFDKRGKAQAKELDDELRREYAYADMLQKLGEKNEAIWKEMEAKKVAERVAGMRALASAIGELGDELGGASGALLHFASGGLSALANLNDEALQAASIWQKLTMAIEGAIDAYNAGKAAGSPGKGALAGAGKGAAAGAAFGPYGMIIGAALGGVIGYFGGKKAQDAELRALRQELDGLLAQAQKAGVVFGKMFDPKNAQQYKAAIDEVKKALDTQTEAQTKLADAVERYGFTVEELGPVMAKQKLDEQAMQLYQDWQLLNAAGIDHEAILNRVGPAVGAMVDQYAAAGVEIPSAMKPIIDDLYTHGKLIHENGEAYTEAEYNGLSYAQTMSEMFKDLIAKVDELVSALLGIPNKTVTVNVRKNDPDNLLNRGGGGGGDGGSDDGGDGGGGGRNQNTRVGPSGGGHVFNIDARHSTNPAATAAAVKKAVLAGLRNDGAFRAETAQRVRG